MDKLDIILEQLQKMKTDITELKTGQEKLENGQKKMQKDITDIHKYLKVGIEEDYNRLKNGVTKLEEKVM